ncbi:hypothetical protein ACEPPN_013025 [Leptodophora sp. 'Broadleaf-Isolate-01']
MSGVEALPFNSLGLRAVKISWEVYNLTKKFQTAPKIIEVHAKDLEVFGNLLHILHTTLQSNWENLSPSTKDLVEMIVTNCEEIFMEFDTLIDQLHMAVKNGEKVVSFSQTKLLMKESSIQLLILRLGGAKSNVGLLLQLLPSATQNQALLSAPVPTATEALAENERIIETMNTIEDELAQENPSNDPQPSTVEDTESIYTFATAMTSNTVVYMQDAILSTVDLQDLNEIRLNRAESEDVFDDIFDDNPHISRHPPRQATVLPQFRAEIDTRFEPNNTPDTAPPPSVIQGLSKALQLIITARKNPPPTTIRRGHRRSIRFAYIWQCSLILYSVRVAKRG